MSQPTSGIPTFVTPGVATGIIVAGFIYWVIFAKIMPWLGYHIDSQPDELVDGSRIVTYKVGSPLSDGDGMVANEMK